MVFFEGIEPIVATEPKSHKWGNLIAIGFCIVGILVISINTPLFPEFWNVIF
jgi:hypothetical protein